MQTNSIAPPEAFRPALCLSTGDRFFSWLFTKTNLSTGLKNVPSPIPVLGEITRTDQKIWTWTPCISSSSHLWWSHKKSKAWMF